MNGQKKNQHVFPIRGEGDTISMLILEFLRDMLKILLKRNQDIKEKKPPQKPFKKV